MPKFAITWTSYIWLYQEIEAETREEALEKFLASFPNDAYEQFESDESNRKVTKMTEE